MRQSDLFTKTLRDNPKDEISENAKLLSRGGFIYKNSAGIYSFLPLGWRVAEKVIAIIRQEMDAIGGQQMLMPALVEKKYLEPTGRWDLDVGYFAKGKNESDFNFTLGWTHEEVLTAVVSKYVSSYKDLPFSAYQIQTKFRHEQRAKSGLLRSREFIMKDLYSFHTDEEDLMKYYRIAAQAYHKIYQRCSLKALYTLAAGGVFTMSNTHEFQVLADVGEDTIMVCGECEYAENREISNLKEGGKCPKCSGKIMAKTAIEVGNIFPLGTKYSERLGLQFVDEEGKKRPVVMGSYGIGIGRLIGAVVETSRDEKGIVWPESISPYGLHLVTLGVSGDKIYNSLLKAGIELLYDDRDESAGVKFPDGVFLGFPYRAVISKRTDDKIELRHRKTSKMELVSLATLVSKIKN